jgi:uncharacterized protein (DUF2237 family)
VRDPRADLCAGPPGAPGYTRDGFCRSHPGDGGKHTLAAVLTPAFLDFSKTRGNDLSTPRPAYGFPGLKDGCRWCLCVEVRLHRPWPARLQSSSSADDHLFFARSQRWKEAFLARGEYGDEIVPKVVLGATHVSPRPYHLKPVGFVPGLSPRPRRVKSRRSMRSRRSPWQTCSALRTPSHRPAARHRSAESGASFPSAVSSPFPSDWPLRVPDRESRAAVTPHPVCISSHAYIRWLPSGAVVRADEGVRMPGSARLFSLPPAAKPALAPRLTGEAPPGRARRLPPPGS